MAAIYFIRGNYEQSVKHYEMVLRLARDYKDINISYVILAISFFHLQKYYANIYYYHAV